MLCPILGEMTGFQVLDTENIDTAPFHVYPFVNSTFNDIQRGSFPHISQGLSFTIFGIYEPPPLAIYINFSPYTYLVVFWGILFFQVFFILILDKTFVKNIPKTATFWERFIHAWEKSYYPFPYKNWHEEKGNCCAHIERKNAVEQEVLLTTIVNLFFNMTLLFPLAILCK